MSFLRRFLTCDCQVCRPFCCCGTKRKKHQFRTVIPNHAFEKVEEAPGDSVNTAVKIRRPSKGAHKPAEPNQKFPGNQINTTKYSILTFLPKNLFEQFHRFANLYFIFVVVLNWLPEIEAFGRQVSMLPIMFVLTVTAVKDAYEDWRRYRSDKKINNAACRFYSPSDDRYVKTVWRNLTVGDLVHLSCNEIVPADILLLRSSDKSGVCYLETSNLDGESNLKQRQAVAGLMEGAEKYRAASFRSTLECEHPNNHIYKFHGFLLHPSGKREPVNKNNLLLRGCEIRNTDFVEGMVVYAGHETKAMLNNSGPRYKRSRLERLMNWDIIWCVLLLLIMCFFGAIGSGVWLGGFPNIGVVLFLPYEDSSEVKPEWEGFKVFWSYVIILQIMIPISLYVTMEMVKLGQVYFMSQDQEMYDENSDRRLVCRALNIPEELGQIQYVMSDKTGTLTENLMIFRRCTIAGIDYSPPAGSDSSLPVHSDGSPSPAGEGDDEESPEDRIILNGELRQALLDLGPEPPLSSGRKATMYNFFINMAICNTVVVSAHPHFDKMNASGVYINETHDGQFTYHEPHSAKNSPSLNPSRAHTPDLDGSQLDADRAAGGGLSNGIPPTSDRSFAPLHRPETERSSYLASAPQSADVIDTNPYHFPPIAGQIVESQSGSDDADLKNLPQSNSQVQPTWNNQVIDNHISNSTIADNLPSSHSQGNAQMVNLHNHRQSITGAALDRDKSIHQFIPKKPIFTAGGPSVNSLAPVTEEAFSSRLSYSETTSSVHVSEQLVLQENAMTEIGMNNFVNSGEVPSANPTPSALGGLLMPMPGRHNSVHPVLGDVSVNNVNNNISNNKNNCNKDLIKCDNVLAHDPGNGVIPDGNHNMGDNSSRSIDSHNVSKRGVLSIFTGYISGESATHDRTMTSAPAPSAPTSPSENRRFAAGGLGSVLNLRPKSADAGSKMRSIKSVPTILTHAASKDGSMPNINDTPTDGEGISSRPSVLKLLHLPPLTKKLLPSLSRLRGQASPAASPSPGYRNPHYEAESPDELALVKAAAKYGMRMAKRQTNSVTLEMPDESLRRYDVLNILPFDSVRKRMSVIVREPKTNKLILFSKGADSAMLELLSPEFQASRRGQAYIYKSQEYINFYASLGLRTLCLCKKTLSQEQYSVWAEEHAEADLSIEDRDEQLFQTYMSIEQDFELLGVTGIEDRLQDGVPETIGALREAGIRVWVLTGDKIETAVNIAYASKLFAYGMELIQLSARTEEDVETLIEHHLDGISMHDQASDPDIAMLNSSARGLVVDGRTLAYCLQPSLEDQFLKLLQQCAAVLCCRATPLQKASVIKLVKEKLKVLTLAIGDGANDVGMIQVADVGVGISGQEGMQAVMASDYAIARFRFLVPLLLVHGHWCYHRLARMVLYFFYKNAVFVFTLFWFQAFNGWSAQVMIDPLYLMFYNLVFTALPPILFAVFDKDASGKLLIDKPPLYQQGMLNRLYKTSSFWLYIGDALWQSLVLFFVPYFVYGPSGIEMWTFGTFIMSALVWINQITLMLEAHSWNSIFIASIVFSLCCFYLFGLVYNAIPFDTCCAPNPPYFVAQQLFGSILYWLVLLVTLVLASLPRLIVLTMSHSIHPPQVLRTRLQMRQKVKQDRANLVAEEVAKDGGTIPVDVRKPSKAAWFSRSSTKVAPATVPEPTTMTAQ